MGVTSVLAGNTWAKPELCRCRRHDHISHFHLEHIVPRFSLCVAVFSHCHQIDQVGPAHRVDDIHEAHRVDPVHQVDHKLIGCCGCIGAGAAVPAVFSAGESLVLTASLDNTAKT